jgi:hypothetical protein
MLLRVGDTIVNLDSVLLIDLNYRPEDEEDAEPEALFEFQMRGWDELNGGANIAQPYLKIFTGKEAAAIRKHLMKVCPDLLAAD